LENNQLQLERNQPVRHPRNKGHQQDAIIFLVETANMANHHHSGWIVHCSYLRSLNYIKKLSAIFTTIATHKQYLQGYILAEVIVLIFY